MSRKKEYIQNTIYLHLPKNTQIKATQGQNSEEFGLREQKRRF
jgi:hypothetical protein